MTLTGAAPLILAVVAGGLFQHPFVTYPLSLLVLPRKKYKQSEPLSAKMPTFSILCCCHNEEVVAAKKVENSLMLANSLGSNSEILFYLDDCLDSTESILRGYGDQIAIVLSEGRTGKSVGMAKLAAMAKGDILVMTDANTYCMPDALQRLLAAFEDSTVGCASVQLLYENADANDTTAVSSGYWKFEETLKSIETSRMGSMVSADGAFYAIRRSLFVTPPLDMIDDLYISLKVLLSGSRIVSVPNAVACEKTPTLQSDEIRRKVRIACQSFNCFIHLHKEINKSRPLIIYQFYSHKVIRWFSFPSLLLCGLGALIFIVSIHGWNFGLMLIFLSIFCLMLGRLGLPGFRLGFKALESMAATFFGVLLSLAGVKYRTWSIAASGR